METGRRGSYLFVLIILIASIANAAPIINITDSSGSSEITLMPSDTIMLQVWYTGDPIISFDIEVGVASGLGTMSNPAITATGRNPDYDYIGLAMMYDLDFELSASADSGQLGSGLAQPLAELEFHCDGLGDVLIDVKDITTFDWQWNWIQPEVHNLIIHQIIPEPATAVIFAAGLFLAALNKRKQR